MKGGFERESLIELYGENGAGKTQTCFTLAIEAIEQWDTDVIWLDVEDTLEPCRLLEIAVSRGYAPDEEAAKEKFFPHLIHKTCPNTDIIMMEVYKLTKLMLDRLTRILKAQDINVKFDESVVDYVSNEGYDPEFGARPMKRAIQGFIENPLSEKLLKGDIKAGAKIIVAMKGKELVIEE